jgi:hypothetical protein
LVADARIAPLSNLLFQEWLLGKQRSIATAALISRAIEGRAYDRIVRGWQGWRRPAACQNDQVRRSQRYLAR